MEVRPDKTILAMWISPLRRPQAANRVAMVITNLVNVVLPEPYRIFVLLADRTCECVRAEVLPRYLAEVANPSGPGVQDGLLLSCIRNGS